MCIKHEDSHIQYAEYVQSEGQHADHEPKYMCNEVPHGAQFS